MNKVRFLLVAFAIAAICVSCEKPQNPYEKETPIDFGNFKFTSTFTPRDTKTEWNKNEKIFIFWENGSSEAAAIEDGETAQFTAKVDSADYYFALYPSTANISYDNETAIVSYNVASAQGGFISRTGLSYAKATVSNPDFAFQSIIPTFKFTVSREDATSVFFRLVSGEAIAGSVDISFKGQEPVFSAPSNTSSEIEVSVDGSGVYYVAFLPGVDLSKGVLMRYCKNGEYFPATLVENPGTISPAVVKDLGAIQTNTQISVASQEDVLKMRDILHCPSTKVDDKFIYDSLTVITNGWIANGLTFNIAPGTYFPLGLDAENGALIDMEYWYYGNTYNSPVKVSIIGTDKSQCFLSGGVDADKTKGTGLFKVQDYTGLTLKNLTLCNTFRPGKIKGGAIQISSKTHCSVQVEDCIFDNNNVLEDGGGAIGMVDGGILTVKDSKFTNNTASYGGSVYGTGVADIYFDNCEFSGNSSVGANNAPSCVMLWGNAYARFNNCVFSGNIATNRAVINSQGTSVLFLNACTFEKNNNKNETTYASAVHAGGDFAAINNCTFYQNNIKNSSNAPLNNTECLSANTNLIVSNTTFYEYFQANRTVITGLAAGKKGFLFNNIILNTYSLNVIYFSSAGYDFKSYGHNVYMNVTDYRTGKPGITAETGDKAGKTKTILENCTYDTTDKVLKWSGNLTDGTLEKASASGFETCVKAFDTALTNTQFAGVKAGDAFWKWITDLGVTNKDQLGTSRGQNNWWPGSYQFN